MLVLDYPKHNGDGLITVPPFHTGHLSFLPDTPLHLYLTHSKHPSIRDYIELLVTPFQRNVGEMLRLSCIMHDGPGVVERLIDAVSDLNINIVTQESAPVNHLSHHLVNMIVDLSSSFLQRSKPPESVWRIYGDYRGLVPLDDIRTLTLFESIFVNCADLILWDDVSGTPLPRLKLERIHTQSGVAADGTAIVTGVEKFHININIPNGLISRIRTSLGISREGPIHYLIFSETEERVLRVFFFKPKIVPRIVHLACYHQDAPKTLTGMLKPIARAQFNIITSLLRKETRDESVWEAILEYRGDHPLPAPEQRNEWAADLIAKHSEPADIDGLRDAQIAIGVPRYPKRADARVSLNDKLAGRPSHPSPPKNYQMILEEKREALSNRGNSGAEIPALRLLTKISRRFGQLPIVFLSYPLVAEVHARVLEAALKSQCTIVSGMKSEGQMILDDIVEKIYAADVFVAIWHHENEVSGQISPWMPFEYGVALASRKPVVIAHSQRVDPDIRKRINPAQSHPVYSDVTFASETVPTIVEMVRRKLAEAEGVQTSHLIHARV